MKKHIVAALVSLVAASGFAVEAVPSALIPIPQKVEHREGSYSFTPTTRIIVDKASEENGRYLAQKLSASVGRKFTAATKDAPEVRDNSNIVIRQDGAGLGPEGYELTVLPKSILIRAADCAGGFYGVQTLLQLLA